MDPPKIYGEKDYLDKYFADGKNKPGGAGNNPGMSEKIVRHTYDESDIGTIDS
jgi:hypothetical protein